MSRLLNHPDGGWVSNGPSGDLRARMSQPGTGNAAPGIGDMHRNAASVLAGEDDVTVNGVRYRRDALGGVSMSTGHDLRAAMSAGPAVPPTATPSASPTAPPPTPTRPPIGDPIAALTAHLPASARRSLELTASPRDASTDALAAAMLARIKGETS